MGQNYKKKSMIKIIRILSPCSMKIFCQLCTVNISKLNFWLVICIAKNFIWTTLKMIFSIFRFFLHPQIPDFQILSDHNKPYINGNMIYSVFRCCINLNFEKWTLMTGFVLHNKVSSKSTNVETWIFTYPSEHVVFSWWCTEVASTIPGCLRRYF